MGITIKDAPLVEQLSGEEKIPISDGSNEPRTVNVGQIKEFANKGIEIPKKVSELENDLGYATSKEVEEAISKIPTPDVSEQISSALVGYVKEEEIKPTIEDIYKLIGTHNKEVKFFCIEPVTVVVGDVEHHFEANQVATVFVGDEDFEIRTTSNESIQSLLGYPIPLAWHDWMEGVDVFDSIVFDMNELETYKHWTQYYQGEYHVQKAQYSNCVFWSDRPYTHSPFEQRTNYTLYYSAQLPLCYSTIPANTYKPFYLAYGVKTDPNLNNPDYLSSYAAVSGATQTFSYYGASAIGIFDMGVDIITLPKDCRGLMYHAPAIQYAGIFDAKNSTNFGAKKGSWQEAFGDCYSLQTLYIRNLKTSINVSWSPLNNESIEYIVNNAINTTTITISVSPYTWNRLTDEIKSAASDKKITIALLEGNMEDDNRLKVIPTLATKDELSAKQDKIEDLDAIREGATRTIPTKTSELTNDSGFLTEHQDISHLATKEQLQGKQDVIQDLNAIREGAFKGTTALQSVPEEYVTESELEGKGYLTEHQDISHLVTHDDIQGMEEAVEQAKSFSTEAKENADAALSKSIEAKNNSVEALRQAEVATSAIATLKGLENSDEVMAEIAKEIVQIAQNKSDIANIKQSTIYLTQAEYNELVTNGAISDNVEYNIFE